MNTDTTPAPLTEPKHSPLPWGVESTENHLWIGPMRADGMKVNELVTAIDCHGEYKLPSRENRKANAELIVTAVNSHSHLLESNRRLVEAIQHFIDKVDKGQARSVNSYREFVDVLAFAKGQQ